MKFTHLICSKVRAARIQIYLYIISGEFLQITALKSSNDPQSSHIYYANLYTVIISLVVMGMDCTFLYKLVIDKFQVGMSIELFIRIAEIGRK